MKKVEKEFQQISEFIDKSRNAAVGFMNYAASLENLCSRWLGKLCSRKMHNWRLPLNLCILKMHKRLKYTLDRTMSPMMVAEYRRLLIPEEVLKRSLEEYCKFLVERRCFAYANLAKCRVATTARLWNSCSLCRAYATTAFRQGYANAQV